MHDAQRVARGHGNSGDDSVNERPAQPGRGGVRVADRDDGYAVEQLIAEVGEETRPQPRGLHSDLRGHGAIVTGGARGIGRAVVLELARHGVHVAFNYIDDGSGNSRRDAEKTLRQVRQLEVNAFCREYDVRDAAQAKAFVDEALDTLGNLHILVNNAGIARDRALWRMEADEWRDVIDTNLTGAFNMIRAVAPTMRAQQHGKIVNISSVHGLRSEFGLANYAASKAGLIGLTHSAAVELGPSNVNVNAVAPGYIRTTRLTEGVSPEVLDRARERSVLGRLGDPQDVAYVVVFLCSELARHVTGAVVPIDGGYML